MTVMDRSQDANAYLNKRCPCSNEIESFVETARNHPVFGTSWTSAFDYYDPNNRLGNGKASEASWSDWLEWSFVLVLQHVVNTEPLSAWVVY